MKKKFFTILVVVSLLALLIPGTAHGVSGLTVSPCLAMVNFPASITISIGAESNVNITDIRLHYTVARQTFVDVISEAYISFAPATKVETQWVWDMRRTGALPPGTLVTYWVTVTDANGDQVETLPGGIHFNDNRYQWKTIKQGQVTLNWYKGDDTFGSELMDAAQKALTRLADNTGAELASPVSFYIYANTDDFQGAMIYPQDWSGGMAFSPYGTILIGIDPDTELDWGKSTIAHELTHLVEYQVTANPYNYLPIWLSEGLAMFSEGDLDVSLSLTLSFAEANDSYLSVRSLCSPFPADYNQAALAYAESYKIVSYLITEYGRDKMLELLNVFKQGSGYDEALLKVYGFDIDGLNTLWRTEPVAVTGS